MKKATTYTTVLTLALGALTLASGCDTNSGETIGPRGGTLVSDDGRFSVDIPEGALDAELELHIETVPCELSDAVGDCYAVSPRGTTFLRPVEVSYELADMDTDLPLEGLGVVAEGADGWRVLADRDVDIDDEVIYASSMFLSEYGLTIVE